jgi:hypothetical protein
MPQTLASGFIPRISEDLYSPWGTVNTVVLCVRINVNNGQANIFLSRPWDPPVRV